MARNQPRAIWAICVAFLPGAVSSQTERTSWRNWIPWENYWSESADRLAAEFPKAVVRRFRLPVDGTIEQRALFFKNQITQWKECPASQPLVVIAHSQGGLDVRYARRSLIASRVRGLLTVGTPHAGAQVAQWALDQRDHDSFWARMMRLFGYDLRKVPFLDQLAPGFARAHARAFAEVEDFESAGHVAADCATSGRCGKLFGIVRLVTGVDQSQLGGGDGLVSVESQTWGRQWGRVILNHQEEAKSGAGDPSERQALGAAIHAFVSDFEKGRY